VLCGVSFISVVEPQFLLYVQRKVERFVVTDFMLYMHTWCVSCKTQRSMGVFDSVSVVFILLWKFLAYVLNVTQRFVMHFISYINVLMQGTNLLHQSGAILL